MLIAMYLTNRTEITSGWVFKKSVMVEVVTKQVSDRLVKFIHEEMSGKNIPELEI